MAASTSYGAEQNGHASANEEQYISTFFCRALYDYKTSDASSLSFRKGDVIEVLTQLESGWWDGLLGDERGWFPSNYVAAISEQEAEAALSGSDFSVPQSSLPDDSMVDMVHSMSQSLSRSDNDADWLNGEAGYMSQVQHPHRQTNGTGGRPTQHNDFWVPQVSQDGRIFYVNTQTGQHARDLPQEPEEPEGDLAGLTALPASRTGSSAGYALGAVNGIDTTPTVAGFGIPRRSRTPEPWVKRLADDGMSYYYVNRLNGQISWTFPESSDPPAYVDDRPPQERPPVPEKSGLPSSVPLSNPSSYNSGTASASSRDTPTITTRLRSGSSTSTAPRDRSDSAVDRTSVYSDDSEVYPLGRDRAESSVGMRRTPRRYERAATPQEQTEVELTPSEQLARFLQQALAPSPPESPVELSNHVREAIAAVMAYLQSAALPRRPEQYKDVDERVLQVVSAVRNLLYVTATPSGHIPSNLYPRDVRDGKSLSSSQSLQVHLKAPQRKVAGTLSKLVLSSLAMQYDPGLSASDKPNRLETDVNELERAVIAFVVEVQQFQEQNIGKIGAKRLHGVFSTANVGLGLPGSGAASGWKGFGYVPLEEGTQPPMQILGSDLLSELKATVRSLGEKFNAVAVSLSRPGFDRERVRADGQHVVAQLSSLLEFIGNIHVSRHVDVDGVRFEAGQSSAQASYMQTIERSRQLLRSLEASTQALYDDGTLFFTAIQTIAGSDPRSEDSAGARHDIESCANTIRMNASFVTQTLDALLVIGYDQSDIGQGDYNSSIEWRSSRISMVNIPIDPAIARLSGEPSNGRPDSEIVDFELAFSRPSRPPAVTIAESSTLSSSATLYNSVSEPSQTSLDLSDRSRSGSVAEPVTPTWPQPDWAAAEPVDHQSLDTDLAETATIEDASSAFFDDEDPSSSKSPPRPGAGAQKIFKLLGPDAPQHYIQKLNAEAKPWYLRPNYDQSEILMDPDGLVRAGTPAALVERLTAHEHGDPTFSQNFLMTFKSFMTVDELFDLLARRFWIEPPPTLTSSEMEEWRKLKQHVIRVRVLNTFKTMITDDGILEKEDMYILSRMKEFASDEVVISFAAAKQLLILIERAERSGDGPIKTVNAIPVAPPSSIVPKVGSKKVKLLDVDPLELARQLTLMEAALYKKIRPMECLQRSRESKPGRTSDNITSIIQLSNRIANWVAESVLGREDSRRRAAVVKHFINVADRCRMIQNYSTMTAIVSGLNTPPIRRLKRTWEQVSARFLSQLKSCESTIDTGKNFNNYRSILARISPPCVPFIGVYLTTLTFINDGAEDRLAGHMINFRKRQKAAEVIQDIKRWQSKPYNFNTVTSVLTYLEESFTKYTDGVDYGDQFWNLSLQREPREREDEKMARLLQESGFL
ncbi:ras GEF [Obba rivulosa]|uniref:Ras GEF n=1 Tax=Obba rivulosa TaxID=1052685 RepID=A0A8E2AWJ2_9APHY|nr:ras GEF [Obba rivulosa]